MSRLTAIVSRVPADDVAAASVGRDNGRMMWLELVAVIALLSLVVFGGAMWLFSRSKPQAQPVATGRWRATHYDAKGLTRIVVQKVSATGVNLLDEHVVAELHRDEPDYDARFLEAMNTARQRQSVFEAEEA